MDLELKEIEKAAQRLKGTIHRTKIEKSTTFSNMAGGEVYLKFENQQKTGSFKIRGAANKIAALIERGEIKSGVASSAGNHAQGVAYASHVHGIPATIVMPKSTPIAKVAATEGYGAKVVLHGDCYDDAYNKAVEIQETEGATFLHPYDDLEVMAGQGTIGIEILEDLPTVDIVVVPAGGGGLLAGVASCIKHINPRVKIIGVQAEGAPAIAESFRQKKHVSTESVKTIADGIAVKVPGEKTVELINKYADDVVTVSDSEISSAILLLLERTKQVVEPSGATPLAAVLNGKVDVKNKKVACVLSGGNIDVSFIQRIIDLGLASRDRKLKFSTKLLDLPGSLEHLSHALAEAGANIIMVQYDRFSAELDPNEAIIHMACEVGGKEHGQRVVKILEKNGYEVTRE
ncbi:MAG TPA: threonine ammonia-lyase [Candidatus Ornithomonoglobus intestinigallinarum]|uniref:L-threonine dehydratase catabolic TdcB n=1 Tax=Candidatus Ornithomonoglobus intestinigallinarum TaxID=2840894 RepID=A0A9D1KQV2_9FIRM|nr:threonine ammonia-lyase [Candidatus Ornithomonoglobus intestinigallinarum]